MSLQCIKLASTYENANKYGQVLDEVQEAVRNGDTTIPLELFLVLMNSSEIHLQHVVDFIVNYNQIYQYTGLYFDEERGDTFNIFSACLGICSTQDISNKSSRLESIFAFDNIENAKNFVEEYREAYCYSPS